MHLKNRFYRLQILILLTCIYGLTACSSKSDEAVSAFSSSPEIEYHDFDVNSFKLNNIVCDPLSAPGNPNLVDGLIAELYHIDHKLHHHSKVQDYFDQGIRSTQKLFFTEVNVPTRVFDTGFPTETGSAIKTDAGENLIEYFALKFKSVLKLGPEDEEGEYELALLSDDGAILKMIDIDGEEQVVVDNDGVHPSRFGCGNQTVHFDRSSAIDVRLEYYQGPRHHISMIPMWRKVDSKTVAEKECGKQGNGRYFDFNHESKPKKKYLELLDRGWKPIAASNWQLPLSSIFNPCQQGTPAKILDFQVEDIGEAFAIVTWETDRPATSQVLAKDSANGSEWITESDNVLRTSHRIVIDQGINFGQTYSFQGISITNDMGKTLSRVREVTF